MRAGSACRQQAFTLIEVMVAMVLAGILVLGVMGLFATVEEASYDLVLRQKAVFLLNGEMERLYGMHQNGSFVMVYTIPAPNNNIPTPSPYTDYTGANGTIPAHPLVAHWVYKEAGIPSPPPCRLTQRFNPNTAWCEPITPAIFTDDPIHSPASENGILSQNSTGNDPLNIVWLDKEKSLTARLSWTADILMNDSGTNYPCYERSNGSPNNGHCYLITLYLDYPFRFNADNPLQPSMGPIKSEILRTILGNRR